jgi:hypothetical protein
MAMLEREEIGRSLTGAWQLFLNRPDAMRFFDVSVGGFWRSFGAIGLIVPAYAIVAIAEQQVLLSDSLPDESFAEGAFVLDKALALSVDWITLPILLALLAGPLGISRTYPAFVVARNWGAVIAILPFAAIDLLFALGLLNADIVGVLSAAMLFVILRYNFIIARRALGVGAGFALTLTVADFVLSLAIAQSVDWLVGI